MIHRRVRATVAGLFAVATVGTVVSAGGPVALAAMPTPKPGPSATVTLVTGDVVTIGGPRMVDVTAARGREHIGFRATLDVDGDITVIPEDAAPLVVSGRLDPRLFDVSELARSGYSDADRKDLPLIVDYPGATPKAAGARAVRELPAVGAVATIAEKSPDFWTSARDSATKIWLDGPVKPSLDQSVPQIGAPEAWAAGHTGAGATVAVLDSGIDSTHPDLDKAVTAAQDFTESPSGTDDAVGHGTHVASTITGGGAKYKGAAPDANLLNGKVIHDAGLGFESWVIAGMEWAAANGADVVNMSIGSSQPSDGTDPVSLALNRLTAETGTLFVVAAGNAGPYAGSIGSPAAADAALTVGAVDRNDELAEFSSRGPRPGDGAIKPDITAPGVDITAAKATNGWIGTPVEDGYVMLSGTSMATPHVAGAAAILAGQHPHWTPELLKSTLVSSAKANPDRTAFEQGAGRVDVAAAVDATVSASPASLNLGTVQWPHGDDQPIAKTVTYANSGTGPVTMDLAAEMTGPDGKPAPAGMFTVSPAQVTVPAGGTASATLTADTRVNGADGDYTGAVVATHGDATVRTAAAVNREVESYDVEFTFLGHEGKPTPWYGFRLVPQDVPVAIHAWDESGTVVARVPKGTYFFDAWAQTETDERWPSTDFNEPAFVVDGPAKHTFDARNGVKLGFTVDRPEAKTVMVAVKALMETEFGLTGSIFLDTTGANRRLYSPSRTTAPGDFTFTMAAQLAKPDGTGQEPGFHASPYLYNLEHADKSGGVPTDLTHHVTDRQLTKVNSTYAVATPGKIGIRDDILTMPLPHTMTEYYTPGSEWLPKFAEATDWNEWQPSGVVNETWLPRSYDAGRTYRERWNVGVFGPGFLSYRISQFGPPYPPGERFARTGDELLLDPGLRSDQNPSRGGTSESMTGTWELLRNGQPFTKGTYPGWIWAMLPRDEATYTARSTTAMPGPLSTRVDAEWTFRSASTPGNAPTPIPALAVRFAPDLDDHNAAKAGKRFSFPVHVRRNGAEDPGRVNTPVVEISYDDGKTWQKVRLTRHHGQWRAEVIHPANAEFASLRSSVSDADGNSAKATIIHAYALTK
ncbi:S8 family serine peptidase [Actinophytocola sp.]|uniref:S8 family serine peptidase n=1 Tax=Actinophytocola sp. TaxID=1872138 RepID=UPI002ED1FBFF